jgi:hypothetical protein
VSALGTIRLLRFPLVLSLGLLLVWLVLPGRSDEAFRAYLLALAAFGLTRLLLALHGARPPERPSPVDLALQPRVARPAQLEEIERLQRELLLARSTSFDLHFRLRPTLRRIASELLRSRRGLDLDGEPGAAKAVLGAETWELVRKDREPPDDRFGPGIDREELHRVVAALEAI